MIRLATTAAVLGSALTVLPLPQQVFRSRADAVPVYISVTGRDGRQITGLTQGDFVLLEDGKRQPVTFFSADRHPFAVALVLDTRWSMVAGSGLAKQADFARALTEALDTDDEVSLGLIKGILVSLSENKTSAIQQLKRFQMTLFDPLANANESTVQPAFTWATRALSAYEGRRIIVLFSDSGARWAPHSDDTDRSPLWAYPNPTQLSGAILAQAEQADVSFHGIFFDDSTVDEPTIRAFAGTGGGASLVARDANYASVARDFVDELHHEYLLAFSPSKFDGKSHKIEVKVTRSGATVHARRSYFAPER